MWAREKDLKKFIVADYQFHRPGSVSSLINTVTLKLSLSSITLEPITQEPVLTYTVSSSASNASCTVLVNCSAASDSRITYSLTVGNQTHQGPLLLHTIRPQDGDTTATCTVSNLVSEKSATKKVTCEKKNPDNGMLTAVYKLWITVS